jgi:hypothetical protein
MCEIYETIFKFISLYRQEGNPGEQPWEQKKWGHPLKGLSREKTALPSKKCIFF